MLVGFIVGRVKLLFQNGGIKAVEYHRLQLVTLIECLMADSAHGVGQGHHLHIAAGKGKRTDTHGIFCHLHIYRIGTCIGDQLQAGIDPAVQGTVDHGYRRAHFIAISRLGIVHTVKGGGGNLREGLQRAHCKGIVTQGLQLVTQNDLEGRQFFFQECGIVNADRAGQVCLCDRGVREGIFTDPLAEGKVLGSCQLLTVGECTLADICTVVAELNIHQLVAVNKGILANGFRCGQVYRRQSLCLNEGIVTQGYNIAKIDGLQSNTACKGILRNLGDLLSQHHFLQVATVGKGIFADLRCRDQLHLLQLGSMVGVAVMAICGNSRVSHGIVYADIVDITGESIVSNRLDLAQIDLLQAGIVVECHIADFRIGTQRHFLQACRVGKGIFTNHGITADCQRFQTGRKFIVEVPLILLVHTLDGKGIVAGNLEGRVAKGDTITDSNALQADTFAEHTLCHRHPVGDGDAGDIRKGEGVFADLGLGIECGQFRNGGFKERILANFRQLAETNRRDQFGRTQRIGTYAGNRGQIHRGDLGIVGERALGQGGYLCAAQIICGKGIAEYGSDRHQLLAIGRQNMVRCLDLVGLAAGRHLKGGNAGFPERKGANIIHIGADGNALQRGALVEHTLRQDGSVGVERGQGFAAGKGISAILDLGSFDLHILQRLTSGKGILADRQKAAGGDYALQLLVAGKGIVRDHACRAQVDGITKVTVFKGILVDDLQIILTAEGNLLQRGTAIERAVFNGLQGRRQYDLFQSSQIGKGIGADLLNALRQHHLGDSIFTDVPLLAGLCIVKGQFFLGLEDIVKVGEGKVTDFPQGQVLGHHNNTTVAVIVGQACAIVNIGILNLHRYGLGVVGASAVLHDLDGNGSKALRHRGHNTGRIDAYNVFVTGFKLNRGFIGEVSIHLIIEPYRLRRIHGQFEITLKEAGVIGVTNELILAVHHIVGFQRVIAGQLECIRHGLIIASVALIPFRQHRDKESDALVACRIAHLDRSLTGSRSHNLIIDDSCDTGPGRSELQQFCPAGIGIDKGFQRIDFIGTQGDFLFQPIQTEVHIRRRQADLIGCIV